MKFEVPEEIINITTECHGEFKCLDTGKCECDVKFVTPKDKLVLGCISSCKCAYREEFGLGFLCKCPTLYALHKKYDHHRE